MLSKNDFNLEFYSTQTIAKVIAMKVREKRLYFNLTQQALSKKSGVSLGSLKRFERTHEISLRNLLLLVLCQFNYET